MIHGSRARRRQALLAEMRVHALELVREHGLGGLTMATLAGRLDMTAGALYRYHPGKDALIADVQAWVLTAWSDQLTALLARAESTEDSLLPVLSITGWYAELPLVQPAAFALMSQIMGDPRPLIADDVAAERVVPPLLGLLQSVGGALAAAPLSAGDPLARALSLYGTVHGLLLLRKLRRLAPGDLADDDLVASTVDSLLCGWGADRAALAGARARLDGLAPLAVPLETP